jgi:hypothetical protein
MEEIVVIMLFFVVINGDFVVVRVIFVVISVDFVVMIAHFRMIKVYRKKSTAGVSLKSSF